MKFKTIHIIIIFLFLISGTDDLFSNQVNRVFVKKNSIYFYLQNLPTEYQSKMSDSKQRVTLVIPNCDFDDKYRNISSNNLVKDISLMHKDDSVEIIINTTEPIGYTAVPLPYSRAILVELFHWDKLDKSEELIREALLGIEDGIYEIARKNLEQSVELLNPLASFHLAIIYLYDGKLKSAFKNLLYAAKNNIDIPDLYAAISQILDDYNFKKDAEKYKSIFQQKSGLNDFPKLVYGSIQTNDSLDRETIKLLMKINLHTDKEYEEIKDTLNKALSKIANDKDDNAGTKDIFLSLFPKWFINYFIYFLILILILGIFLILSYQRWKRKQILLQNEKVIKINRDFDDDLNQAKSSDSLKQKAIKTYKEFDEQSKEKINEKIKEKNTITEKKQAKKKEQVENQPEMKTDLEFQTKIESLAKQLTEIQEKKKIEEFDKDFQDKEEGLDAKTKLAMHLQEKNFLTKQELISKLSKIKVEDEKSLVNLAQKMKIEKSIIETKSKIKSLDADNEKLKTLKNKFNLDDNSKNNDT